MAKRKEKPKPLTPAEMARRGQERMRKRLGKRAYLQRLREIGAKGGRATRKRRKAQP